MGKPAIFWDRDDTLIADPGYLDDPGKVELLPGAVEAVKRLAEAGFENIIITNQSGIARGLFNEATLGRIHDHLRELFSRSGANLDALYYCPYLPGEEAIVEQYRRDSDLRKPKPGMLLRASLERKIDLVASWSIGNSLRDAQAGRAAGTRTIVVCRNGPETAERKDLDRNPAIDFVVDSLEAAVEVVLKHTPGAGRFANGGKDKPVGLDNVVSAIHEVLSFLKMADRRLQRDDFSLSRLAGTVVQIAALAAFFWSVFAWVFTPDDLLGNHLMRLMVAVFLQLFALTLYVVSSRPK